MDSALAALPYLRLLDLFLAITCFVVLLRTWRSKWSIWALLYLINDILFLTVANAYWWGLVGGPDIVRLLLHWGIATDIHAVGALLVYLVIMPRGAAYTIGRTYFTSLWRYRIGDRDQHSGPAA